MKKFYNIFINKILKKKKNIWKRITCIPRTSRNRDVKIYDNI